jgi:hypothetical protein
LKSDGSAHLIPVDGDREFGVVVTKESVCTFVLKKRRPRDLAMQAAEHKTVAGESTDLVAGVAQQRPGSRPATTALTAIRTWPIVKRDRAEIR